MIVMLVLGLASIRCPTCSPMRTSPANYRRMEFFRPDDQLLLFNLARMEAYKILHYPGNQTAYR